MPRWLAQPDTVAATFAAAVFATACMPRQTGDQAEAVAATPDAANVVREPPRCVAPPAEALGLLPAAAGHAGCGVALLVTEGRAELVRIPAVAAEASEEPAVVLASGSLPSECGPTLAGCELWGTDDALGPALLLAVHGPESGAPTQVYIGWVEQGRLGFAPSWFGLPSVADHTRIGPPWALAPHDCDGELLLLASPRLPEAAVEEPSESVQAAAGRWTIPPEGEARLAEPRAVDPSRCRPLFAALP